MQICEGLVGKLPIVFPRPQISSIQRRTISQEADAKPFHKLEVLLPVLVVAAFLHLVDALGPAIGPQDSRGTVLDTGREHELRHLWKDIQPSAVDDESRARNEARFIRSQKT